MAVRVLPRAHAPRAREGVWLPPLVLAIALMAPALDVFALVQPSELLGKCSVVAAALATGALVAFWLRFPRTNWLTAAGFAATAGLMLRLLGAEVAPLLSLLSIVALGIGGAYATRDDRDLSLVDA